MQNGDGSFRTVTLSVASALGIATIVGVIGWVVGTVVTSETRLEHLSTVQSAVLLHIDKLEAEIEKHRSDSQSELREGERRLRDVEMELYRRRGGSITLPNEPGP